MGNCSLRGVTQECPNPIRILTDSGDIVEFRGPTSVKDVVNLYPGHGIFRQGHASTPLSSHEYLTSGQFYYLLPVRETQMSKNVNMEKWVKEIKEESPKKSSSPKLHVVEDLANGPAVQVLPSQGNGTWKVKLLINTRQLEEILSEQINTEALIEKMRMAAMMSSASLAPRRSKSSWKPVLSNVFKVPN